MLLLGRAPPQPAARPPPSLVCYIDSNFHSSRGLVSFTTLEAMLAVQFGGSDNIRVDWRNHSATGESWRRRGGAGFLMCVCLCVCVISETKGAFSASPSSPRLVRARDRLARLPNTHFPQIPLLALDSVYSVPCIPPGFPSASSDVLSVCSSLPTALGWYTHRHSHTSLHLALCLQVSPWPRPSPQRKQFIYSASLLTF